MSGILNAVLLGVLLTPSFCLAAKSTAWPESLRQTPATQALVAFAFPKPSEGHTQPQTDAVLIVKDGQIIFERYANGYHRNLRHIAWSVTKSLTNAVLGLAVKDKLLALEDSICKHLKVPHKDWCSIRVVDVAGHTSGIKWSEMYEESEDPLESSVLQMLYGAGNENIVQYLYEIRTLTEKPGTKWRYSSGDSNLLMGVIRNAYGKTPIVDVIRDRLQKPLGMTRLKWETDSTGLPIASSYSYATARDMARFGQLFLQDGVWQGEQILPTGWVARSTQVVPAAHNTPQPYYPKRAPDVYGLHWWLNHPLPKQKLPPPWPATRSTTFAAMGHWGQLIFVVPDKNIVAVRFGNDRHERLDPNRFIQLVEAVAE